MRRQYPLGVAAFVALGCGTVVEATPLNVPPRALAARPPSTVEVYTSGPPSRSHIDVALLRAEQTNGDVVHSSEMLRELIAKAAQIGCDAIVISGFAERAGATGQARLLDPGSHVLLATCIAYPLPSAAVETAWLKPTVVQALVAPSPPAAAPYKR